MHKNDEMEPFTTGSESNCGRMFFFASHSDKKRDEKVARPMSISVSGAGGGGRGEGVLTPRHRRVNGQRSREVFVQRSLHSVKASRDNERM